MADDVAWLYVDRTTGIDRVTMDEDAAMRNGVDGTVVPLTYSKNTTPPADAALADADLCALIIRDLCETEPANPDDPDSVCVTVDELRDVITRHISAALRARAVPDDAAKDAKVGAAIERAAKLLPRDFFIEIEIENGTTTVRLYDDECVRLGYDADGDTLAGEINEAIDAAILSATDAEVKNG